MILNSPQQYQYSSKIGVLLVEDDLLTRRGIAHKLEPFAQVIECDSAQNALKVEHFDMAIIDLDLESERAGLKLIKAFATHQKYLVVLTGHQDNQTICEAYQQGCHDYLCKPFDHRQLEELLLRFNYFKQARILKEKCCRRGLDCDEDFLFAASSELPILLLGETGTGKTALAQLIHSSLDKGPFVHLNCSEIPESLLESELFGHSKGAFSGALCSKIGKLELADGGTLFLDELGTMPLSTQKKLLRALEEKSFYPLGSTKKVEVHFRIISATCDDLEKMMEANEFRRDLYFRLAGFTHQMPALRERSNRIPEYIDFLLARKSRKMVFDRLALQMLMNYDWPGNFRELAYLLRKLESKRVGFVRTKDLKPLIKFEEKELPTQTFKEMIKKYEKKLVQEALEKNKGHVRKTVKSLGISNAAFYNIMRRSENEKKIDS